MKGKGFTLVELLVTISILAILATIALISYGNIQRGARDGRRKSDISSIQSALEQYHADQGVYPSTITFGSALTNQVGINPTPTPEKKYLSKIPQESLSGQPAYSYTPSAASNTITACDNSTTRCINYCLNATVENSSSTALASICPSGSSQYQVQAP